MGSVSAASTTTAGPSPLPHMTSSFSIMEPSELSIEVGELEEMMMDVGNALEEWSNPFELSISRGSGRLDSEGTIMVVGVDDVITELEYEDPLVKDTSGGKLICDVIDGRLV